MNTQLLSDAENGKEHWRKTVRDCIVALITHLKKDINGKSLGEGFKRKQENEET